MLGGIQGKHENFEKDDDYRDVTQNINSRKRRRFRKSGGILKWDLGFGENEKEDIRRKKAICNSCNYLPEI